MFETLQGIDNHVLLWINTTATAPWLDWFFANITDLHKQPWFVIPAAIVVIFFAFRKFKWNGWRVLVGLALAISISDVVCYRVLKAHVERPRPFQSELLADKVVKRGHASGNSFPSNHAANCFAAACILGMCFPSGRYVFYIFALLVGYSRIYLGLHYPSDVLTGGLVGYEIARLVAMFTVFQFRFWSSPDL